MGNIENNNNQLRTIGILTVARKKRQIYLYEKLSKGKHLTRAELKELERIEERQSSKYVVETQKEVADFFHVSIKTISRWIKEGMPQTKDGNFSLLKISEWNLKRQLKLQKRQNASFYGEEYRKYKAKLAELEYKKAIGEVVLRKEAIGQEVSRILVVKKRLLNIPHRLAPQLVGLEVREIGLILTNEINAAIDEFAGKRPLKIKYP